MTTVKIEHEGPRALMVSSLVPLTPEKVRSYVGSGWTVPAEWVNVIGGEEVVKPNPCKRRGRWQWLLRKEE
jgi:hypothetical protein